MRFRSGALVTNRKPESMRQEPPHAMRPFASGVVAASLADRPWDCPCTWVPVAYGEPGAYRYGPGSRLKFASAECPHRSHKEAS